MADYLSNNLADFLRWVRLQKSKRPTTATALGLSTDETEALDEADEAVLAACAKADAAQTTAQAATATAAKAVADYKKARRQVIARFKTDPRYTEALGRDNQWIGEAADVDPDTLQPTLDVVFSPEGIRLDWSKKGQDGVEVFRRQAGETAWEKLAFDSRSPYIDTETGLTGTYEYYVQLLKADRPVGLRSAIVTALHGGR